MAQVLSRLGSKQWEGRSWAQAEPRTVEKGLHMDRQQVDNGNLGTTAREVGVTAGGEDKPGIQLRFIKHKQTEES